MHTQLSLRHHSYSQSSAQEPNTQLRRSIISCLICQTAVYSVSRIIAADTEGRDGPVLPTDDWVEDEVLKGADGYVEVHSACLSGSAVANRQSSSSFSSLFSVVLPPVAPVQTGQKTPDEPPSIEFLAHMKAIFPAPPFTPSHPIFVHLSSIAATQSESLRKRAEDELAALVRNKIREVDQAENEIRSQVNALWTAFRDAVKSAESTMPEGARKFGLAARRKSSAGASTSGSATLNLQQRPSVTGFEPSDSVAPIQSHPSSSIPKLSTLSSSLATSSFHHPGARNGKNTSATTESIPGTDFTVPLAGQNPRTSQIATDNWETQDASVLDCRMQMNQAADTATSYRYFLIEDQMRKRNEGAAQGTSSSPHRGTPISKRTPSETRKRADSDRDKASAPPSDPQVSSPRSKKERRVTFEVKPDVVTIQRDLDAEKAEEAAKSTSHTTMMFDMEDDGSDAEPAQEENASAHILPFIERTQPRTSRPNPIADQGLPASYQAIRPASLPAFSLPLPAAKRPSTDTPRQQAVPRKVTKATEEDEAVDEREAEILKLVAANTPSHRGAWKKNSKAWKAFVARHDISTPRNRRSSRSDDGQYDSDEDSGFDDDHMAFVGSLPVDILPAARSRNQALNLASYQPKSTLAVQSSAPNDTLSLQRTPSASASRRAAYAERDLSRSMDPGAHDFSLSGAGGDDPSDEEDQESTEETERRSLQGGQKGRNYAKKILQARSAIPDDGMWRSLAT